VRRQARGMIPKNGKTPDGAWERRASENITPPLHHSITPSFRFQYGGSLEGFHLMLQPMLGFCGDPTARPASTASAAARSAVPVTRMLLSGRLSSNSPQ
jgi:hypothetical protein